MIDENNERVIMEAAELVESAKAAFWTAMVAGFAFGFLFGVIGTWVVMR